MEVSRFGFQQEATIVLDDTCIIHKTSMHGLWEAKYLDIVVVRHCLIWNSHCHFLIHLFTIYRMLLSELGA